MFLVTASAHWGVRSPDLVRMVPLTFPDAELLVTITGVAEIAGAVGLLVPRLAPWAAAAWPSSWSLSSRPRSTPPATL